MSNAISDYNYYVWLGNTAQTAMLTREQGYLCLQRFLKETKEGKI
jgi:hypothetical protein